MSSTKHTPGPWAVEPNEFLIWGECIIAEDGDVTSHGLPIASCDMRGRSWARDIPHEEHEANARLIAAAPELLEALKEAESMFRWYGDLHQQKDPPDTEKAIRNYDMAEKLAAVVAKAEGRTDG